MKHIYPVVRLKSLIKLIGLLCCFCGLSQLAYAQPPSVLAIMVDACGFEGGNEYVIINTGGAGFNTSNLQFSFDANNNTLACGGCIDNNDINIDIDNPAGAPTPCGLQMGNASLISGCNAIAVGPGFDLPPNAFLVLQTSAGASEVIDYSGVCGPNACVYVIQSTCVRTIGAFSNASGSGVRTNIFAINGTPFSFTITYDQSNLANSDGAYYLPGTDSYGDSDCSAPPVGPAPTGPDFDDPMDITACASSNPTFPAITGTNLTGSELYYDSPGGMGLSFGQGTAIPAAGTYYIYDPTAACPDEEDLVVNFTTPPTATPPTDDLTICFTLIPPGLDSENSADIISQIDGGAGNTVTFYFDAAGTNDIDLTDAADIQTIILTQPTTIFATVDDGNCESTTVAVNIVIEQTPTASDASLTACDGGAGTATFDLTSIEGTVNGGSGNPVNFFTDMMAMNPIATPGAFVSGTATVFATVSSSPTGACQSDVASITLNLDALQTPSFSFATNYCASDPTVTLPTSSDNGIGGSWVPATIIPASDGPTLMVTFTPDNDECASPVTETINITAAQTPSFSFATSYCSSDPAFTLPTTSDNGVTGTWSPPSIDPSINGPSVNATFTPSPGVCANGDMVTITINTAQNPSFSFATDYCSDDPSFSLPTTSDNGVAGSWSPASINPATDGPTVNATFTPNPGLCANTVNQTINIATNQTPTFSFVTDYCTDEPAFNFPTTSDNGISGSWSPASVNPATDGPTVNAVFTPDPGICASSFNSTINIATAQTPTFSFATDYCASDAIVTLPTTSDNGISGSWSPASINPGTDGPVVAAIFTPSAASCTSSANVNININPAPSLTLPGVQPQICQGDIFDLSSLGVFDQNLTGATISFHSASPASIANQLPSTVVAPISTTTYFAFADAGGGCQDEISIIVNVAASPNITGPLGSLTGCNGVILPAIEGTDLVNPAYYTAPGGTGTQFFETDIISANTTLFMFDGASGCSSELPIDIFITPGPDLDPIDNVTTCGNFTLPAINGDNLINPSYFTGPNGTGLQFNVGDVITGDVTLFAYDNDDDDGSGTCNDQQDFQITISAGVTLDLSIENQISCAGGSDGSLLLAITGSGPFQITWNNGIADGTTNPTGLSSGTYTVNVTDGAGCTETASIDLFDPPSLSINCSQNTPASGPAAMDGEALINILGGTPPYSINYTGPSNGSSTSSMEGDLIIGNLSPGNYNFQISDNNGCPAACTVTINGDTNCMLSVSLSQTDVSCFGGNDATIMTMVMDGTAPFSYAWDNGDTTANITDVLAGPINLIVTDAAGCTASASTTVNQPDALILDCMAGDNSGPNDDSGTATVTFGGGTSPYNIDVTGPVDQSSTVNIASNLSLSGLPAGDYDVVLTDANNCTTSCTFTILAEGCNLMVNFSEKTPTCPGASDGGIDVQVINGLAPFTFNWSPDLGDISDPTDIPAGEYFLTVTDADNCEIMTSFILMDPPAVDLICEVLQDAGPSNMEGVALLTISGGVAPYKVDFINTTGPDMGSKDVLTPDVIDLSDLGPGLYEVTVRDANDCETSCSFIIEAFGCDFVINDIITTNALCHDSADGSAEVIPGATGLAPFIYLWSDTSIPNTEPNPTTLAAGTYTVTVLDANNCKAEFNFGIGAPDSLFLSCLNPTPATGPSNSDGTINFEFGGGTAPYVLHIMGPTMLDLNANSTGMSLFPSLLPGSYIVELEDANGCTTSCEFVIGDSSCFVDVVIQVENETCENSCDGLAYVEISGGQEPYTILWDTGATSDSITTCAGNYSVVVTDANGCTGTAAATILPGDLAPALTLFGDGAICASDCATLNFGLNLTNAVDLNLDIGLSGQQIPTTITITGGSQTLDICPADFSASFGDTIRVELGEITNGSCVIDLDTTYLIPIFEEAQETVLSTLCQGDSLVIGGEVFNASNQTGQVILPDASINGCDSTVNVTVVFFGPAIGFANDTICQDESIDIGGEIFDQNNSNGTVIIPGASINGCDSTIFVNISFFPTPLGNLDPVICPGDEFVFEGQIFDENTPNGQVLLPDAAANGCDSMVMISLSFFPTITGTLNETICEGDSFSFGGEVFDVNNTTGDVILPDASVNGCDSTVTITIDFFAPVSGVLSETICEGDSFSFGGQVFDVNNTTGDVILPDASVNGCDSTVTVTIDFFAPVSGVLNQTICEGDSFSFGGQVFDVNNTTGDVILPDASVNGCDSTVTVTIDFFAPVSGVLNQTICEGDSFSFGGQVFDSNNTTGDVILPDASVNGCDSTITVTIDFFNPAVGSLDPIICPGDDFTFGGITFDQNMPSGEVILPDAAANGCDSTVMVNLDFFMPALGSLTQDLCEGESLVIGGETFDENNPSGTIILENASVNGCDSSLMVNLNFLSAPTANLIGEAGICLGESTPVSIELSPGFTFDLVVNDGLMDIPLTNISGGFSIDVSPALTTTYTIVSAIAVGSNCPVVIGEPITITVSELSLSVDILSDFQGFGVSCPENSDGELAAVTSNGAGALSYIWSNGEITSEISGLAPGDYTVMVTDEAGCAASAEATLTAPTPIIFEANGLEGTCANPAAAAIEIPLISGGAAPYEYSLDGQFFNTIDATPFLIGGLSPGTYAIEVQDANDCRANLTVVVPEFTEPQLELGDDVEIQLGDSVQLIPQIDFLPSSWRWSVRTGLNQPDSLITFAAPANTTVYTLTITDEGGCTVTDMITIFVNSEVPIYVPSVFSPNGDGANDFFSVLAGDEVLEVTEFQIFDRWGNLVFEGPPYVPGTPGAGWDGTFNGQDVNAAVYVYYARVQLRDGRVILLEGDVTLVR